MADHIDWVEHKGKRILYLNYAGLSRTALLETVQASMAAAKAQYVSEDTLLMLVDVRDAYVGFDLVDNLGGAERSAARLIRKLAIVGLTGFKRSLVGSARRLSRINMQAFDTPEAAMAWLVEDEI